MSDHTGAGILVRLAVRRDRVLLGAWPAVFVLMAAISALATVDLYPTLADQVAAAESLNASRGLVALYGRVYDPTSIGAIAMIKMGGLGGVFVAMLAVGVVVRHTRGDEEAGRWELVASTATGRGAALTSALGVALAANLVLAVLTALTLIACGLPVDGSVAFGLAWAGVGAAFAAIAGLAAQVTTSGRAATALSAAVLAVVYVLRAIGDAAGASGPRWLSWLSPIGWSQQFRPYAGNRWWVLAITVSFSVAVATVARAVAVRRDLGTGLIEPRAGSATASALLATPLGLAWRLHRVAFAGWAVGFTLIGALLGSLAGNVADFLNNPNAQELITRLGGEKGLTDAFLSVELGAGGIIAAAYAIHVVMRLHAEETALHADAVLATAVGRVRWAWSHVVVGLVGSATLLALTGTAIGATRAAQEGDAAEIGRMLGAALVRVPAAWLVMAVVVALFGFAPRFVPAGWGVLVGVVLLAEIGPLLELDQWVLDLNPFAHVPNLPGAPFRAVPLVVLTALAAAVVACGLAGFRRRDVA